MSLTHALTLTDLTLFGVASIIGSGGFNLIGSALRTGGIWWPVAFGCASILLLGASHTYSRAIVHIKNGNTVESDIVKSIFGSWMESATITGIIVFNIISISVILVFSSHILLPDGSWIGQITIALAFLAGMTLFSLQEMEIHRNIINIISISIIAILVCTSIVGCVGLFWKNTYDTLPHSTTFNMDKFSKSFFMFFFILAGFDALIKFTDEAVDKADIPRSFYTSNIISDILTFGIAITIFYWIPSLTAKNEESAFEDLVGHFLGGTMKEGFKYMVVAFMITTTFVVFLAMSRYLYGLGKTKNIPFLTYMNENNAPYAAVGVIAIISAIGIFNNHTDTLVMVSDFGLIMTILFVSAAATVADWRIGEAIPAIISSLTTAGFGGFLSLYALG